MPKSFKELTEQEILALAISSEEDDARIYGDVAQRLRNDYPASARIFEEEQKHSALAGALTEKHLTPDARAAEDAAERRLFLLQIVQPGLAGLMDGSVSTLAPLFAAAFATQSSGDAFRVGLAASVGAGISMGFAEALSDDGSMTGRGRPLLRGVVCGLLTTAGGI